MISTDRSTETKLRSILRAINSVRSINPDGICTIAGVDNIYPHDLDSIEVAVNSMLANYGYYPKGQEMPPKIVRTILESYSINI